MDRVLERFKMKDVKLVSTLLANHFKLSEMSCPTTHDEKEYDFCVLLLSSWEFHVCNDLHKVKCAL